MSKDKKVAVLIPGLLGSCLRVKATHSEIWGEDMLNNYRRLANETDLIDFNTKVEAYAILKKARFYGFPVQNIYEKLETALRANSNYAAVHDGYYDWRKSSLDSAPELIKRLSAELAVDLSISQPGLRLRFITHSMGALVLRAALINSHLHCDNVWDIYHVAPPLLGAPSAFRSLFTEDSLPMLSWLLWMLTYYPDTNIAVRNLLKALSVFPSVYELMPRKDRRFIHITSMPGREPEKCVNPIYEKNTTSPLLRTCVAKARAAHAVLDSFSTRFSGRFPVHVIYGDRNNNARTDLQYYVSGYGPAWTLEDPVPFFSNTDGDGAVPDWSCTENSTTPNRHGIPNCNHHAMCSDDKVLDKLKILGVI